MARSGGAGGPSGRRLHRLAWAAERSPYYREPFRRGSADARDLTEATLAGAPAAGQADLQSVDPRDLITEAPESLTRSRRPDPRASRLRVSGAPRPGRGLGVWSRALRAFGHGIFDRQVNVNTGVRWPRADRPCSCERPALPRLRNVSSFDPVDSQIEVLRRLSPTR